MMIKGDEFQGDLEVGTRVHCILYGGNDGIIFKVNGAQEPGSIQRLGSGCVVTGGNATFDVVFDNGSISRAIPECIIRGCQWSIQEGGRASNEEIQFALAFATLETDRKETEAEAIEKERSDLSQKLQEANPELELVDPKAYDSLKKGSQNLKTELKRAFPETKFSVRSESCNNGGSINVHWIDGPRTKAVEEIANKYQEGHFNGMIDLYETDHGNVWPGLFGGAKFVFCRRDYSKETYLQAVLAIEEDYGITLQVSYSSSGCPFLSHDDDIDISKRNPILQYASRAISQRLGEARY